MTLRPAFVFCMLAVLATGCATAGGQGNQAPTLTVETLDGSRSVTIVLHGETRNEQVISAATDLQKLRDSLSRPRPSISAQRLAIAREAYDEGVRELIAFNELASSTSSANPRAKSGAAIRQLASDTRKLLATSAPPLDNVTTRIDAALDPGYRVFYIFARRRASASASEWQSYTFGQPMGIGLYVFRVVPVTLKEFEEAILIFDDPTQRTINPR